MSPIWVNVLLAVPFVLGWIGIPLWMIIKLPEKAPDFAEAHAYLAATRQPVLHLAGSAARQAATTGDTTAAKAA